MESIVWSIKGEGVPTLKIRDSTMIIGESILDLLSNPDQVIIGYDKISDEIVIRRAKYDGVNKLYDLEKRSKINGEYRIANKTFIQYICAVKSNKAPSLTYTNLDGRYPARKSANGELVKIDLTNNLEGGQNE